MDTIVDHNVDTIVEQGSVVSNFSEKEGLLDTQCLTRPAKKILSSTENSEYCNGNQGVVFSESTLILITENLFPRSPRNSC